MDFNNCPTCGCRFACDDDLPGPACVCTPEQAFVGLDVFHATGSDNGGGIPLWQIPFETKQLAANGTVLFVGPDFLIIKQRHDDSIVRSATRHMRCTKCAGHLAGLYMVEVSGGALSSNECTTCHTKFDRETPDVPTKAVAPATWGGVQQVDELPRTHSDGLLSELIERWGEQTSTTPKRVTLQDAVKAWINRPEEFVLIGEIAVGAGKAGHGN